MDSECGASEPRKRGGGAPVPAAEAADPAFRLLVVTESVSQAAGLWSPWWRSPCLGLRHDPGSGNRAFLFLPTFRSRFANLPRNFGIVPCPFTKFFIVHISLVSVCCLQPRESPDGFTRPSQWGSCRPAPTSLLDSCLRDRVHCRSQSSAPQSPW